MSLHQSDHIAATSRTSPSAIHVLKCWPQFFSEIKAGRKRHDLRRSNDRHFQVGDRILLREFDPRSDKYTGSSMKVVVTYITSAELPCALSKDALHADFCILSIAPSEE
ncbi:DUF3850 domain-containing protein [Bradyrhizobium sp. 6(2017)]|uniref:DUF3850 domain-containing protein n=1 Tax=Bradyrhizobium sp. 6(2017) TaxID=1197460 RepID=UPI0013E1C11D|nr:DUF3850 domain-containing protein [Bradyrhizobium sp. 6(2017)]